MYNRYVGNTGKVIRVEEESDRAVRHEQPRSGSIKHTEREHSEGHHNRQEPPAVRQKKPSLLGSLTSLGSISGGLAKTIDSSLPFGLETADLILLALFLFLYIESGDEEFLIILGFFVYSFFKDGKE